MDLNMEEILAELEELEGKEDPDDFSFMDYARNMDPDFIRKKHELESSKPSMKVGASVLEEKDPFEDAFTVTDEEIRTYSSIKNGSRKVYRSMIKELFTPEQLFEIEKLIRTFSITNNQKIEIIKEKLTSWNIDYFPLGGGTNRWAFMYEGYVIKIACDEDGKIDNKREYMYSRQLQPLVVKCYETLEDGLMAVFEYVEIFTNDDFWKHQNEMREIISQIAENFLIGDVGVSSANYVNWGFREDHSLVILDYAYIYAVAFKKFECGCVPGAYLSYDRDFNNLICPYCGRKYTFADVRKKITKKDQLKEIGDITKKGYILYHREEEKEIDPKFVSNWYDEIKSKLLKKKRKKFLNGNYTEEKKKDLDGIGFDTEDIIKNITKLF